MKLINQQQETSDYSLVLLFVLRAYVAAVEAPTKWRVCSGHLTVAFSRVLHCPQDRGGRRHTDTHEAAERGGAGARSAPAV